MNYSSSLYSLLFLFVLSFSLNAFTLSSVSPDVNTNNFSLKICSNSENDSAINAINNTAFNFTLLNIFVPLFSSNYSQCGTGYFNNSNNSLFLLSSTSQLCNNNTPSSGKPYEQCVNFVLNTTYSNASTNTTIYSKSFVNYTNYTLNYIFVNTTSPNILIMFFNESTKSFVSGGPALSDGNGIYAEHCVGNLTGKQCTSNHCTYNGAPPAAGGGPGGQGSQTTSCSTNGSTLLFFNFNAYGMNNLTTPNLLLNPLNASTSYNDVSVGMISTDNFFFETRDVSNPQPPRMYSVNMTGYQVLNYSNASQVFFNSTGSFGSPAFLTPNTLYYINLSTNYSGNLSYALYPLLVLSRGMGGGLVQASNLSYDSTFISQVVNETGSPVANAIVYAQTFQGFSRPDGVTFVNSTVTDSNGLFTLKVPGGTFYKFLIASAAKDGVNNGYLYFPTLNDNNNRGFESSSGRSVVLPAFTLKKGATLNTNITLNGVGGIAIELFQYLNLPEGPKKVSYTSKMLPVNLFQDASLVPTYVTIPSISPINNLSLSVFGFASLFDTSGQPPTVSAACFNTTTVSTQGSVFNNSCVINSTTGTLNLSISACQGSIFSCSSSQGDNSFLFDSRLFIKNQTSGRIVSVIDDGTFLLGQSSFRTQNSVNGNFKLILPAGNYTIISYPKFDFRSPLGINYSTNITITANVTSNLTINRQSQGWEFFNQLPFSMSSSQTQPLRVSVVDFSNNPPSLLNDTKVNVTVQVIQVNGTNAGNMTDPIFMTFLSSTSIPTPINYNGTFEVNFTPSVYSITAGKYYLLVRANTTVNGVGYFKQQKYSLSISDFITGVDLSKSVYGTSENITGNIFTFNSTTNPPTALNGSVTLYFYKDGNLISNLSVNDSNVTGMGNFTRTLSSLSIYDPGFYELIAVATVNASNSTGYSSRFFQVSNILFDISYDKQFYKPSDIVNVTLTIKNSSGSALTNASVQASVDGSQAIVQGYTDSSGKVTLTLNSSVLLNSEWSFGFRGVKFKVSKDLSSSVLFQDVFSGFQVRGFELFFDTEKKSYSSSEPVNLFFGGSFGQTPKIFVDGTQYSGDLRNISSFNKIFTINPNPTWSSGFHVVKASFQKGSDSQDYFTSFEVKNTNIKFNLNKPSYSTLENISLTVFVMNSTNGQPVNNMQVNATVYKSQGTNDLQESTSSGNTYSNGSVYFTLNSSSSGFHYIKIVTSDLQRFAGFFVSDSSLSANATLDKSSYSPGDSVTLLVNTTAAVNSTVDAKVWVQGNAISLPSASVNSTGQGVINFTIPSDAPTSNYFIEAKVTTPTGNVGFTSTTLNIGGRKLSLIPSRSSRTYLQSESVNLTATLLESNNTPVANVPLTLELSSKGGSSSVVSTGTTDSNGKTLFTINSGNFTGDGEYVAKAYVTASSSVNSYSGFRISVVKVSLGVNTTSTGLNTTVLFTFNVTNSSSGSSLTPTSVVLNVFDKTRGVVAIPINVSGSQPYNTTLNIPSDASAVGFYNIVLIAVVNGSTGDDSTFLRVVNSSATLTLVIPQNVTSGGSFLVNVTAGSGSDNVTINIFSPGSPLALRKTVALAGGFNSTNVTNVTTPGRYIVSVDTSSGSVFGQLDVLPSTAISFYSSYVNGTNSTTFNNGDAIVVNANLANTSAVFLTNNGNATSQVSVPLALNATTGLYAGNYTFIVAGTYLVRLDSSSSTGISGLVIKVN